MYLLSLLGSLLKKKGEKYKDRQLLKTSTSPRDQDIKGVNTGEKVHVSDGIHNSEWNNLKVSSTYRRPINHLTHRDSREDRLLS